MKKTLTNKEHYERILAAETAHETRDRIFDTCIFAYEGHTWQLFGSSMNNSPELPNINKLKEFHQTRLGSLIVEGPGAELVSKDPKYNGKIADLEEVFRYLWTDSQADIEIKRALSDALLFGTAVVKVALESETVTTSQDTINHFKAPFVQHIPIRDFYIDPLATSEKDMTYCYITKEMSMNALKMYPQFRNKKVDEILTQDIEEKNRVGIDGDLDTLDNDQRYPFFEYYYMYLDSQNRQRWGCKYFFNGKVIHTIKELAFDTHPFMFLREQETDTFWGSSSIRDIIPIQIYLDEINSILWTHARQRHNPSALIDSRKLTTSDYSKLKKTPGSVIAIQNLLPTEKVMDAVHLLMDPDLPRNLETLPSVLIQEMQNISGVTPGYVLSDTGSVQTSQGIQDITSRSTLRDNPIQKALETFLVQIYKRFIHFILISQTPFQIPSQDQENEGFREVIISLDEGAILLTQYILRPKVINNIQSVKEAEKQQAHMLYQNVQQYGAAQPADQPPLLTTTDYLKILQGKSLSVILKKSESRINIANQQSLATQIFQILQQVFALQEEGYPLEDAVTQIVQQYSEIEALLPKLTNGQILMMSQQQAKQGEQDEQEQQ